VIGTLAQLGRVRVTALSSLSAAAGYVLYGGGADLPLLWLSLGTGLMAAGASALNQVQERNHDARMERTCRRPLPAGRLSTMTALAIAALWLVSGAGLLGLAGGYGVVGLGILAAVLYNALYTPLKRVTAFAVLPGSIIGALPPAMGWVAAGGGLSDSRILALMFFFFVWQMPHFWLLVLRYGREYEKAGFPTVTGRLGTAGTIRVTVVWILATGIAGLLVPWMGALAEGLGRAALAAASVTLGCLAIGLLLPKKRGTQHYRLVFVALNSFALLLLILLVTERFTGQF
jgi:heme o synthase